MRFVRAIGVFLAILITVQPGWSQESRGTILGRLTDSSGAVVPGVTIRLTHVATGVSRNTETNTQGNFSAPQLPSGIYEITAEKQGFKRYSRAGVELRIAEDLELNIALEVGAQTESVTVTAETPLLETASASMGQVVDSKNLAELPMSMGGPFDLIRLGTTVQFTATNYRLDQPWELQSSVSYSMGGSDSLSTEITMDGASNSLRGQNPRIVVPGFTPPSDAVAEMKVQTATFDGTVGQTQGGSVNISLKSGTNNLHGTAYYSFLPTVLTANSFYGNKSNLVRPDSSVNRWGGVATGPVWLPGIYNGKNKTFFMYAYEGIHYASQRSANYTVPTAVQRGGDLSSLLAIGPQYQLYNPFSARSIGGGRIQRDPIAGNIITTVQPVSSIATKLLNPVNYALPITAGDTVDGTNNLPEPGATQHVTYFTHTARIDHNFSEKHRLFVRVNKGKTQYADPLFFGADSIYSGTHFWYLMSGFAADDVYTLSPTTVMNIRVSDSRLIRASDSNPAGLGIDLTQAYGFPAYYNNAFPADTRRTPNISLSDYSGFSGASYENLWKPQETRTLVTAFDKILGAHGLKFGFEYRQYRQSQYQVGAAASGGSFSFDSTYTKGPYDNSTAAPRGQGLAAFLLGVPSSGSKTIVDSYAEQSSLWAGYLQDDWKVNRKLTLNLSLRYELEGPLTERYNRSIRGFDPNAAHSNNFDALAAAAYAASPISQKAASDWSTKGGVNFAGVGGVSREMFNRDTNNIAPRIGFAYSMDKGTVVRGGYGFYFGPMGYRRQHVIQTNFNRTTNLVPTLDSGLTFVASLANPFPDGFLQPIGAGQGADTYLGQSLENPSYFNPDIQASRTQKWQIDIQRELPHRILVEIGYVGSKGDKFMSYRDQRYFPSQYLSTSPVRDQPVIDYWTGNVANPFKGLLSGTSYNGSTIQRNALIRNFPQFTSFWGETTEGNNLYGALQAHVERRFSQGFTFQFGYTWSKMIESRDFLNPDDPAPEKAIGVNDYPHHITANYIFELPFGKGRKFLSQGHPVANAILGGWQIAGIWTLQSGGPLGFGDAIYYGGNLADVVLPADQRSWSRWFNTSSFEKSSAKQLSYHYRTLSSRFTSVRGARLNSWDMSAIKNTRISEKTNFQFRFEALNAFNQVWLEGVNTSPSSTSFGQFGGEGSVPRKVQMQFKLVF